MYGSTRIELAWTVVPFLIVMVLFLTAGVYALSRARPESWRPFAVAGLCVAMAGVTAYATLRLYVRR